MLDCLDLLTLATACRGGVLSLEQLETLSEHMGRVLPEGDFLRYLVDEGFLSVDEVSNVRARRSRILAGSGSHLVADLLLLRRLLAEGQLDFPDAVRTVAEGTPDGKTPASQGLVRSNRIAARRYAALWYEVKQEPIDCPACGRETTIEALSGAEDGFDCRACGATIDLERLLGSLELHGPDSAELDLGDTATRRSMGLHDSDLTGDDEGQQGHGSWDIRAARTERRMFGEYEVLDAIGGGGVGKVYRARHRVTEQIVALKVLHEGAEASEKAIKRFQREGVAVAKLRHPNIVRLYHFGEEEGCHYLTMELIEGTSLGDRIEGGDYQLRSLLEVVAQTADGLDYAHGQGLIHRDVKPSNILIDEEGVPHIADFGLVKPTDLGVQKLTRTGALIGTPYYMAPEQLVSGAQVDRRTDVYALGVILYEVLTRGRLPFFATSAVTIMSKIMSDPPTPPSEHNEKVHRDIETICLKALEKDPGRRYPSAEAMSEDIRRYLRGEPIEARPAGRVERLVRSLRRNRLLLVLVLLPLLAGVGWGGWTWGRAVYERHRWSELQEAARRALQDELARAEAQIEEAREAFLTGSAEAGERADEACRVADPDRMRKVIEASLKQAGATEEEEEALLKPLKARMFEVRASALFVRASARSRAGGQTKALQDLVLAYRLAPAERPGLRALIRLGEHLLESGEATKAQVILERAASRLPAGALRGEALARAGDALLLLGRPWRARVAYRQALQELAREGGYEDRRRDLEARTAILGHIDAPQPFPVLTTLETASLRSIIAHDMDADGRDDLLLATNREVLVVSEQKGLWRTTQRLEVAPNGWRLEKLEFGDATGKDGPDCLCILTRGDEARLEIRPIVDGTIQETADELELLTNPNDLAILEVDGDYVPELFVGYGFKGRVAVMYQRSENGGWTGRRFFPPKGETPSDVRFIVPAMLDGLEPVLVLGTGPWNHWEILVYELQGGRPRLSFRERVGPVRFGRAFDLRARGREVVVFRNDPASGQAVRRVFGAELEKLQPDGLYLLEQEAGEPKVRRLGPRWSGRDLSMDALSGSGGTFLDLGTDGRFVATLSRERPDPAAGWETLLDLIPVDGEGEELRIGVDASRAALLNGASSPVSGDFNGDGMTDVLLVGTRAGDPVVWILGPQATDDGEPFLSRSEMPGKVTGYPLALQVGRDLLYLGLPRQAAEQFQRVARMAPSPSEAASALLAAAEALGESGEPTAALELCQRAAERDPWLAGRAFLLKARYEADQKQYQACLRTLERLAAEMPLSRREREELERLRSAVRLLAIQNSVLNVPFAGPEPLVGFRIADPIRTRVDQGALLVGIDHTRPPHARRTLSFDGGPFTLETTVSLEAMDWDMAFEVLFESVADDRLERGVLRLSFGVGGGGTKESHVRSIGLTAGAAGHVGGTSLPVEGFPPSGYEATIRYLPNEWRVEARLRPVDGRGRTHVLTHRLTRLLPGGRYRLGFGSRKGEKRLQRNHFGHVRISRLSLSAPPDVLVPVPADEAPSAETEEAGPALAARHHLAAGRAEEAWRIYDTAMQEGAVQIQDILYAVVAAASAGEEKEAVGLWRRLWKKAEGKATQAMAPRIALMRPRWRRVLATVYDRTNPEPLEAGARKAMEEGWVGPALLMLDSLVDREKTQARIVLRARCLIRLGRFEEAMARLREVPDANQADVLEALGDAIYAQRVYRWPRDLAPAFDAWTRAMERADSAKQRRRIEQKLQEVRSADQRRQ